MITLQFKALTQKKYRIAIFLIVLSILIPVFLFMVYVVANHIINLKRFQLVAILGFLGILSFFILGFIVNKTLSKKFELNFNENELTIASEKIVKINYSEIESILIHNNSDYSNINLHKMDGTDFKLFVGMANLLRNKNILEPASQLDDILEKHFEKEITHRKGIEIIKFKRRNSAN